jgi:hypothetical protein
MISERKPTNVHLKPAFSAFQIVGGVLFLCVIASLIFVTSPEPQVKWRMLLFNAAMLLVTSGIVTRRRAAEKQLSR